MKRSREGGETATKKKKWRGYVQHQLSGNAPRAIDVVAHASQRISALLELESSMGEQYTAKQLAPHLRRRATAHNRRGRRRGPASSRREQSGTSAALVRTAAGRPRIHRRQPYLLHAQWSVNNGSTVASVCGEDAPLPSSPLPPLHWPTHTWHAKRFAMAAWGEKEGWELPALLPHTRADAGLGAVLRWSRDWGLSVPCRDVLPGQGQGGGQGAAAECVAFDSTALHLPLRIQGSRDDVLACLQRVLEPTAADALQAQAQAGAGAGAGEDTEGTEGTGEGGAEGAQGSLSKAQRARKRRALAKARWRQGQGESLPTEPSPPSPPVSPLPVHSLLYPPDSYPQAPIAPVQVLWAGTGAGERDALLFCPAPALRSCLQSLRQSCQSTPCTVSSPPAPAPVPLLALCRYSLRGHPQAVGEALGALLGRDGAKQTVEALARGVCVWAEECRVEMSAAEVERVKSEGGLAGDKEGREVSEALWRGHVWELGPVKAKSSSVEEDAGPLPSFMSCSRSSSSHSGAVSGVAGVAGGQVQVGYPLCIIPAHPLPEGEHCILTRPAGPPSHLPAPGGVDLLLPSSVARAVWGMLVRAGKARAIGVEGWRAVHTARGLPCFPWGHPDSAVSRGVEGSHTHASLAVWREVAQGGAGGEEDFTPTLVHGVDHALDMLTEPEPEPEGEGEGPPPPVLLRVRVRCVGAGGAPKAGQALYVPAPTTASSCAVGPVLGYVAHGVVADGARHSSCTVGMEEGEGVMYPLAGQGSSRCPPRGVGLAFIGLQQARACLQQSPSLPPGTLAALLGPPSHPTPVLLTLT